MRNSQRWTMPIAALTMLLLVAGSMMLSVDTVLSEENDNDPGPIRFTEQLIQDKYGYAYGVAAADLDGDGHLDLTSVDTTNDKFYWFAGDGKGNFTRFFIGKDEPGWLERHLVGDINGDGLPDVVCVKNKSYELVWYENPGMPRKTDQWKRHVIATKFFRAYDVALADFDGDGHLDVGATCYVGNEIAWFRNPGKGENGKEWVKETLDSGIVDTRTARAVDMNGDGKIDLLGTSRGANMVAWYENPGKLGAKWTKHLIDGTSANPAHGHAVDFDGDGDPDVVMAVGMLVGPGAKGTNEIVWYENVGKPGKGTEWKRHVIGPLVGAFEAFAVDLDGDGKLDIAATAFGPNGKLVWFKNPGDPAKSPWPRYIIKDKWINANQVIAADMNKDGRPDLIGSAERGSNDVRWWRNDGPRAK